MEKHEHNDPLDDYVRRSFDEHEEHPASDMWSRIETELPAVPETPAWQVLFLRHRLRLAVACMLLLLSGLVCEHFYYENKLRALVGETEPSRHQLPKQPVSLDHAPLPRSKGAEGEQVATAPPANVLPVPQHKKHTIPLDQAKLPIGVKAGVEPISDASPEALLQLQEHPVPLDQATLAVEVEQAATAPPAIALLEPLPQLQEHPLPTDQALLPTRVEVGSGIPVHNLSGWYIGLHATPHRTFESTPSTTQRPGMRPVYVSQSDRPEVATDWWLRVGKSTGRRFGLESGIGFSESARTTAHTARFRFADGAIHPGGPGGQRRNFSYDLSTYGGSAAVSLRMESADDTVPVADSEPVVVRISTTEQARLLRIPLLLSYRMGGGRVQAVAKAGLIGNFFLTNDLTISARASQNSRLRFAQSAESLVFERSGNFFLGYWASAGLEFRWNRQLGIVAEPAVTGNFARTDAQGRPLPDLVMAGLNLGINWKF